MYEKLARWLLFGVLFTLLPFVLSYLNLRARSKSANPVKIVSLFARGELLLVSTAIRIAAVGELFGVKNASAFGQIISGGVSLLLVVIQALWYASVSEPKSDFDADFVGRVSVIFAVTVLASVACLLVAGV